MSEMMRRHTARWSRFLFVLLSVVGLSAALAACGRSIESPDLRAGALPGSVTPDLVCTEQLMTNVVITGSGFAPLPTKTLEGPKTELVLPTIELIPAVSLDGSVPPTSSVIVIPDDPANPGASHVHFLSDTQMSFDIDASLNVPGGVYDVVATNPDTEMQARWPAAIALIPPPEVTELMPPALCDDQSDQTLTIVGRYFLKVDGALPKVTINGQELTVTESSGCVALQANLAEKVEVCGTIEITIPRESLPPGDYDVIVTNPGTASCSGTSATKLTINAPPRVDAVVPQNVCSGGSLLTISGANFLMGADGALPTVELRSEGQPIASIAVEMSQPGTELKATFGPGAAAGTAYDVVVINPDGCEDRPLPHKQVNGVDGPILFYVDPPVVANAVNTRVTLYATAITKPLAPNAVTIVPAGQMGPATVLDHNDVAGFPKRLQAIVPKDQAPGVYDVYLDDATDCSATVLAGGLTVAADQHLSIARIEPPFGRSAAGVPVTIIRDAAAMAPADAPFAPTPGVFLNPAASTSPPADAVGIEVNSVAMTDPDTLTAVVPENTPPGLYDVVVVNPDGLVGILADGYTSLAASPPVINTVTPPSVAASSGQVVVVSGDGFRPNATVSLTCVGPSGAPIASPPAVAGAPSCAAADTDCTISVTIDATVLGAGSVCVLRVTNEDGSYGEFSAIGVTTPSLNLETPKAGTPMNIGRRGLASGAAKATNAARYVFAIGGDDGGSPATVFNSVESAPVDLFGKMGAWSIQRSTLGSPRVFAGAATAGRYLYVAGGSSGAMDLATVERALLLSPAETPIIADVDLILGDAGLTKGEWFYRVSAVFDAADTDNPGGESLASDAFTIRLPEITGKKISVVLSWSAPEDGLGAPLLNVSGYRIYRTPMADGVSGQEVLLASIMDPAALKYTDDGSATPGTEAPLPLGSTGAWAKLPDMAAPRSGLSLSIAPDPADPEKKLYLYAIFGKSGNSVLGTYELLPIDVAPSGRQTAAASWTPGTAMAPGRWHHNAWVADRTIKKQIGDMPNDPDTTYIYVGGGADAGAGFVNNVNRGRVQPGGQLDALAPAGKDLNGGWAGYGVLAAAGQLFLFGGDGGLPATKGISGQIVDGSGALANNSWNAGLSLLTPRSYMGSSVQSAFAFFIGGSTNVDAASKTTELVVW